MHIWENQSAVSSTPRAPLKDAASCWEMSVSCCCTNVGFFKWLISGLASMSHQLWLLWEKVIGPITLYICHERLLYMIILYYSRSPREIHCRKLFAAVVHPSWMSFTTSGSSHTSLNGCWSSFCNMPTHCQALKRWELESHTNLVS